MTVVVAAGMLVLAHTAGASGAPAPAQDEVREEPLPELPAHTRTMDQVDPEFWAMTVRNLAPLAAPVYLARARKLLAEGTLPTTRRALSLLKGATHLFPEDAAVQALFAEALAAPYRWTWDRDEAWIRRARDALARAQDLVPDLPQVQRAAALLAMLDNRLEEAEGALRSALESTPGDTETLLLLGAVLRLQARYGEAYPVYGRAIEGAPGDWRGYSGLGDVYRDDEWYEEALDLYGKASRLQPLAFPPRFGEATVFHRVRYGAQALRMYRRLLQEFPDNKNLILLSAAATHMLDKKFGFALEELEQVSFGGRRGLCDGSVLYRIGLCRMRLRDLEGAETAFRRVLEEYPEARDGSDYGPLALFGSAMRLSSIYESRGLPEEAAEVLRRASQHPQAPLSLQLDLSHKLQSYKLFDQAVAALRRGLAQERSGDLLSERVHLRVELARALAGAAGPQEHLVEARDRLGELEDEVLSNGTPADCYEMARGLALAGATQRSVDWLSRAVERGYHSYDLIRQDPDLAPIRDLPAYRELVRSR